MVGFEEASPSTNKIVALAMQGVLYKVVLSLDKVAV